MTLSKDSYNFIHEFLHDSLIFTSDSCIWFLYFDSFIFITLHLAQAFFTSDFCTWFIYIHRWLLHLTPLFSQVTFAPDSFVFTSDSCTWFLYFHMISFTHDLFTFYLDLYIHLIFSRMMHLFSKHIPAGISAFIQTWIKLTDQGRITVKLCFDFENRISVDIAKLFQHLTFQHGLMGLVKISMLIFKYFVHLFTTISIKCFKNWCYFRPHYNVEGWSCASWEDSRWTIYPG